MERQNTSFATMKELADKALSAGFSQSGDYLAVWCQYCDYLRRRIKWEENHEEQLETFRLTVEAATNYMFVNYGKDGDPEAVLQQTWAHLEAKFCKNQEKAREIWNQIMQSGHGSEAALWLQYYRLERMFGDNKHCRRILQKALNSVTDWPETIIKAYLNFEREEGDLEQYDTALVKCEAQMERINERRAKAAEKEEALQVAKKKDMTNKKSAKKQKLDLLEEVPESGQKSANSKIINKNKRKFDVADGSTDGEAQLVVPTAITEEPPKKKARESDQPTHQQQEASNEGLVHGEYVRHDPAKDNVTAFVSNLDFAVEESKLKEVFQECGEIVSIRLARNYKGRSKGFGYVEFIDSNCVLQALKLDREFIDGRPMFVSRCEDKSVARPAHQFKYATRLEKNKLFIKGLPFTITKEILETMMKEHGKIKEIRMVTYRNGSPKGLAYVEYDSETSASQAILKTDGLQIGEHTISVAFSNPPERKTPLSTRMDLPGQQHAPSLGGGKKETEL
uniref:RRM domain-containing protein n=2 Tax=Arion vulgaris TaxID=1028688 RepID=A0A0B7B9N7_9EUPU